MPAEAPQAWEQRADGSEVPSTAGSVNDASFTPSIWTLCIKALHRICYFTTYEVQWIMYRVVLFGPLLNAVRDAHWQLTIKSLQGACRMLSTCTAGLDKS